MRWWLPGEIQGDTGPSCIFGFVGSTPMPPLPRLRRFVVGGDGLVEHGARERNEDGTNVSEDAVNWWGSGNEYWLVSDFCVSSGE